MTIGVAISYNSENLNKAGEDEYYLINSYSQLPKYGNCWKNALLNVNIGYKSLIKDKQSKLAIMFTSFLLKHLDADLADCQKLNLISDENFLKKCFELLKNNNNAFVLFTEFFTHTQNICFFLQN